MAGTRASYGARGAETSVVPRVTWARNSSERTHKTAQAAGWFGWENRGRVSSKPTPPRVRSSDTDHAADAARPKAKAKGVAI
jgi:hypothetical protein